MSQKGNNIFWYVVVTAYAMAIALSFLRIYVFHDYPIFYSEEDIPDMAGDVINAINFLDL